MKKFTLIATILCMFIGASSAQANAPESFADLAEKLSPAVVNISSTHKIEEANEFSELQEFPEIPGFPKGSPFEEFFEHFMDRRQNREPESIIPPTSLGSGFIIDAQKGYVVTNAHVIEGADEISVTFQDDVTLKAEIVGRDQKTDLAVLKIIPNGEPKDMVEVSFGDSDKLRVGDWILAIGNPFGLGGTVTAGIISARQRDIQSGPYDDYLQTDASINRGNSGGPMFNLQGEVIGINTAIFSPTGGSVGIGFAVPAALAKPVINQIIEYGRTRRGWLGVRIQTVTDEIAESLGMETAKGALVAAITKKGPAEKAGLKIGDIILGFDGQDVPEMRDLPRIVAETKIDSTVKLEYWRDNKRRTTKVTVGELEKAEESGILEKSPWADEDDQKPREEGTQFDELGMRLAPITPEYRDEFGIQNDVEGLVVVGVTPKSEARKKGLIEGDSIIEINQDPVKVPKDVDKALKKAKKDGRSSVLLLINRAGDVRFIALKITDEPKS